MKKTTKSIADKIALFERRTLAFQKVCKIMIEKVSILNLVKDASEM